MNKKDKEIIRDMFIFLAEQNLAIWDKISGNKNKANNATTKQIAEIKDLADEVKKWIK